MQDGEEILGAYCWPNIEDIEELSMEYWNLRKLKQEETTLSEKVSNSSKTLSNVQNERASLADLSKGSGQELSQKRERLFEKIEDLNIKRDDLLAEAQQTKRKHSALKMQVQVLKEEGSGNQEKINDCRESLTDLRIQFTKSKEHLVEINDKVDSLKDKLSKLQEKIDDKLKGSKEETTESFTQISKANRDITKYQAELGVLREEQAKYFRGIGSFLRINSKREDCKAACKNQRGLLEQTRLLSQSIDWNRHLAERVTK
jgi:chromosome segregation ATPase